jgi:hypothetical protein
LVLTALAAVACRVTPLDVGMDRPVEHDARDEPEAAAPDAPEADAALTLEERLRAACAEDPGPSDDYFSGAELTARLVGRWFNCDPSTSSPIQDGDGDGIVLAADGTWALLSWNTTRSDLDAAWTTAGQHGTFRYHFFVDSEAGAAADSGIVSSDIARDDTKNRTPLVVYLDRAGSPDGFNHTFSKKPRQMTVVESASALRARYVPVD